MILTQAVLVCRPFEFDQLSTTFQRAKMHLGKCITAMSFEYPLTQVYFSIVVLIFNHVLARTIFPPMKAEALTCIFATSVVQCRFMPGVALGSRTTVNIGNVHQVLSTLGTRKSSCGPVSTPLRSLLT